MARLLPLAILLLAASTAFAQQRPARGMLLVSAPGLPGAWFREAVVLVIDAAPHQGSTGLILNKPTGKKLVEFMPELEKWGAATHELRLGGPVETNRVTVLFRGKKPPEKSAALFEGVVLAWSPSALEELLKSGIRPKDLRLYAGFASWGAGQLEHEMARGDWRIVKGKAAHVFDEDPAKLWEKLDAVGEQIPTAVDEEPTEVELLPVRGDGDGFRLRRNSGRGVETGVEDLDVDAEVGEAADEFVGELGAISEVEVVGGEVVVLGVVAQHVVGGGQHRSGDRDDGLHRAPAAFEAQELGSEVGVLLP